MAKTLDRETLDALVDVLLDYNGTPRRHLFEYPYNVYESRAILAKAENAVKRMVGILESQ